MLLSITSLASHSTYTEKSAPDYSKWLEVKTHLVNFLSLYSSITQVLITIGNSQVNKAVVLVAKSVEGSSASIILNTTWKVDFLQKGAFILRIHQKLISQATSFNTIQIIYPYPHALESYQKWLEQFLPQVQLILENAISKTLQYIKAYSAIKITACKRVAQLYKHQSKNYE